MKELLTYSWIGDEGIARGAIWKKNVWLMYFIIGEGLMIESM